MNSALNPFSSIVIQNKSFQCGMGFLCHEGSTYTPLSIFQRGFSFNFIFEHLKMMEEQSASNKGLLRFPEEISKEETFRIGQNRFCESPFKRFISSGLLLKGFALAFGLWNPRPKWRSLFALGFLLFDAYLLVQAVVSLFFCAPGSTMNSWFCVEGILMMHNYKVNITSTCVKHKGILDIFCTRKWAIYRVLSKVSQLVSHLTFFWSVWMLSKENSCVAQENTAHLVSPSRRMKLNCVILLFFCALISSQALLVVDNSSPNLAFTHMSYGISWWASLLSCWLFGTILSSLETLVTRCKHDIMTSDHLEDAIKRHQQLCEIIFATTNIFKPWFIVNWIVSTITCVYWFVNLVFFLNLVQSWSDYYIEIFIVVIYLYIFMYPCYKAAALTGKCKHMLADFNLTTEEDWHDNHPFRMRSELHLFLQYASYVDCGYRVGRFTFGSMSVFFSTLLAVVGIALKIH